MSLLEFFHVIQFSPPLVAMRSSSWLFPVIATFHLMGLSVVGGSVLIVNLRLMGMGLRRQSVTQLTRDTEPWLWGGLAVMALTGIPLFMCFATKYYYLTFFWVKMAAIVLAVGVNLFVRSTLPSSEADTSLSPGWSRFLAVLSLSLWTTVAVGGRWIGFP